MLEVQRAKLEFLKGLGVYVEIHKVGRAYV
jgi:hypothetical protein